MSEYQGIDLETFDLDRPEASAPQAPEPEPAKPEPVVAAVREGIEGAARAMQEQNAQFLNALARTAAPPQSQEMELPKWDDFDVPDEIASKAQEDIKGAFREFGRHVLAHATPVYTRAIQNAAAHGAHMGSQNAIAAIEGQRLANEHAPTFQRLPEQMRAALSQTLLADPEVVQAPSPQARWQAVERKTQALANAFGAAPQPSQGYAGSSVRSDIAPQGGRASVPGSPKADDNSPAGIANFLTQYRR